MWRAVAAAIVAVILSTPLPALAQRERRHVPRIALWMEVSANLQATSTREGIARVMELAAASGVDTVIPEAKNAWGYVAYPSTFAPNISGSLVPRTQRPEYAAPAVWYPRDFDQLGTIIEEAHARNLKVHVSINSFSEGLNAFRAGPAFDRPEWASVYYVATRPLVTETGARFPITGSDGVRGENQLVVYTPAAGTVSPTTRNGAEAVVQDGVVTMVRDRAGNGADPGPLPIPLGGYLLAGNGAARAWMLQNLLPGIRVEIGAVETRLVPSTDLGQFAFTNPANPEAQLYVLAILREVLTRYDVDGIVIDRARFANLTADFSETSRTQFERWLRRPAGRWPEDVYTYEPTQYWMEVRPGPLYRDWLAWRAEVIKGFVQAAGTITHELRPRASFSAYVGAWYPLYFHEGVNWASPSYAPPFDWASPSWQNAGIAPLLDYLMVGLYYPEVREFEAAMIGNPPWRSVTGGALLAREVVNGATPVLGSVLLNLYPGDPARARAAMTAAASFTDGLMLFDLVYLDLYNWWSNIPQGAAAQP